MTLMYINHRFNLKQEQQFVNTNKLTLNIYTAPKLILSVTIIRLKTKAKIK